MPQLMEVLEFLDDSGKSMVHRVPRTGSTEIKWGAQLTVRENQEVIFYRDGVAVETFNPGRYVLETKNLPLITKWVTSFGYGPDSPFRAEVYFFGKQLFTAMKWGTSEPILFSDSRLQMVRLRSFGLYSIQIADPRLLMSKLVGTRGEFSNDDLLDYFKGIVVNSLTKALGKLFTSIFDVPTGLSELNEMVSIDVGNQLKELGVTLYDFHIQSVSVPEDVQRSIDSKTGMSAVGDINEFLRFNLAKSLGEGGAASNQNTALNDSMSTGIGLGLGMMMPQLMQNTNQQASNQSSDSQSNIVERLKALKELLDLGIISQQEFDTKKNEMIRAL